MSENNKGSIHIHGEVKQANISTGKDVQQTINIRESAGNDEPKPEWAGRLKLFLQILAVIAAFGIAIAAWYKIFGSSVNS